MRTDGLWLLINGTYLCHLWHRYYVIQTFSSTCHDGDSKTIELTCTNSFNELNVNKKSNIHHCFMFGVVIRKETNTKENYAAELEKKTKMYEENLPWFNLKRTCNIIGAIYNRNSEIT